MFKIFKTFIIFGGDKPRLFLFPFTFSGPNYINTRRLEIAAPQNLASSSRYPTSQSMPAHSFTGRRRPLASPLLGAPSLLILLSLLWPPAVQAGWGKNGVFQNVQNVQNGEVQRSRTFSGSAEFFSRVKEGPNQRGEEVATNEPNEVVIVTLKGTVSDAEVMVSEGLAMDKFSGQF
jgi:hypothetical protein